MSIKIINNTGICLAECSEHGTVAAINVLGEPKRAHLWMVTVTRDCISEATGGRLYPVVSTYFCIAQSAEDAISQVKDNAFPELNYVPLAKGDELKCVAARIPFQVRGWGRQTF
jgi:hypothetical protein